MQTLRFVLCLRLKYVISRPLFAQTCSLILLLLLLCVPKLRLSLVVKFSLVHYGFLRPVMHWPATVFLYFGFFACIFFFFCYFAKITDTYFSTNADAVCFCFVSMSFRRCCNL